MKQREKVVNEEHFHIFFKSAESENIVSHGNGSWCSIDVSWLNVPREVDHILKPIILVLARATIVTAPLDDLTLLIHEREDGVRRKDHVSSNRLFILILSIGLSASCIFITNLQQETVGDDEQVE